MKIDKKRTIQGVSISVGLAVLGVFALNGWALSSKEGKDPVVVTVNEVKITRGQVDEKVSEMLGAQAGMIPPEKMEEVRSQMNGKVIENMIIETLLMDAIEKQGIVVNDQDIDDALAKIRESVPPETDFQEVLKAKWLSEERFRKLVTQDLRIRKLLENQVAGLNASADEELLLFYKDNPERFQVPENVEVEHILVSVKTEDTAAVKADKLKRAEEIRQQLIEKNGANFEEIAAEVSDCPSKARGGMLGAVTKGQTVKPFDDAAFSQKEGEIGPVVETSFGYHIIKVLKHHQETTTPFADAKESISDYLLGQKKQNAVIAYIDGLKAQAAITYAHEDPKANNPS